MLQSSRGGSVSICSSGSESQSVSKLQSLRLNIQVIRRRVKQVLSIAGPKSGSSCTGVRGEGVGKVDSVCDQMVVMNLHGERGRKPRKALYQNFTDTVLKGDPHSAECKDQSRFLFFSGRSESWGDLYRHKI